MPLFPKLSPYTQGMETPNRHVGQTQWIGLT
jgi:hypothetical protein